MVENIHLPGTPLHRHSPFLSTMSTRKRRGGTVNSRQAQKRTREAASTPEISLETEPIELVETAGDEIVDLTCESLEPVVVDLTHNDSVVIVDGEWFHLLFLWAWRMN